MTKFENDFTKAFEKLFAAAPVNFDDAFKNAAEYNAKFSKIAVEAAKKNAELSQAWTKDTLGKMSTFTKPQGEAADYAKVATEFVSAQAQAAPEHVAALADVVKQAQSETVELMLAAGKEMQAEVAKTAAAAKKAA